jgi:NADH dehydrogenase
VFQPLLYQVATTVLSPGQIAMPLRKILQRYRNVEVLLDEVTDIDMDGKKVETRHGASYSYDYLVVSAGVSTSYFGHDDWRGAAPGLKSLEDALEIRRRILLAFERAERDAFSGKEPDPLTFAIIGGGPTGVELSGAIADIARLALAKSFKSIDTRSARVLLFEAADRVLGAYPQFLSDRALQELRELGVEVRLGTSVEAIEPKRIRAGGEWIPVSLVLWATGATASPLGKVLGVQTGKGGRIQVQPDLSLPGRGEVFVLGDMAQLNDKDGKPLPGLAAVATQQGRATALNILRDTNGRAREPFRYRDKGILATVGRNRAVAHIAGLNLSGLVAWVAWAFIHIYLLIGFRNRVMVMAEWIWAYFTSERSAPLITGEE